MHSNMDGSFSPKLKHIGSIDRSTHRQSLFHTSTPGVRSSSIPLSHSRLCADAAGTPSSSPHAPARDSTAVAVRARRISFGPDTPEVLFTSKVFEGMGEDYFVSRNFLDSLFTSPGFERIIPSHPHKSPPL
jgi:hypothetical protein